MAIAMRFRAILPLPVLLLWAAFACASEPPHPLYVNGVFEGALRGQGSQSDTVYLVESEGALYRLTPKGNLEKGYGGLLLRSTIPHSVLAGEHPSAHVQLRSDGRHFFVKVGNRESEYAVARIC